MAGIFTDLLFGLKSKTLCNFKDGQFDIFEKHGCPPFETNCPIKKTFIWHGKIFWAVCKKVILGLLSWVAYKLFKMIDPKKNDLQRKKLELWIKVTLWSLRCKQIASKISFAFDLLWVDFLMSPKIKKRLLNFFYRTFFLHILFFWFKNTGQI